MNNWCFVVPHTGEYFINGVLFGLVKGDLLTVENGFLRINDQEEFLRMSDEIPKISQHIPAPKVVNQVEHPSHYNKGKYECIDVIEDWKLGFNLGNCLKYMCRAEHKGKELEDLKKAKFYLERQISLREKELNEKG